MLITFLGLGTAGFRALEVKLLGPTLVGLGTIMSLLGIMSLFMLKNDVIVEEKAKNHGILEKFPIFLIFM